MTVCRKIGKVCSKIVKVHSKMCRMIVKVCVERLRQTSIQHECTFFLKDLKIIKTPPSCQFVRLVQLVCQKLTNLNNECLRLGSG